MDTSDLRKRVTESSPKTDGDKSIEQNQLNSGLTAGTIGSRQHANTKETDLSNSVDQNKSDDDKDADELNLEPDLSTIEERLPQDQGKTEVLDSTLKNVSPRWKNWIIRFVFTWMMIFGFGFIIYLGPLYVALLILLIQIKCFHEIITIGYVVYKSHELPWFRTLSWYFLVASNYFFYGESMITYFGVLMSRAEFLNPLVTYHRFISFSLYCAGLVGFVFSLVKKHYLKQFTMFGWTHVTLLIIVTQSHMFMQNIFEGLIWFLVPVSMIICNDIMAYMFGFFFGKTPLIKLSPKKTWEGFIGGAFSTIVFGVIASYFLLQYDSFVCPIEYDEVKEALSVECERGFVFRLHDYNLPMFIQNFGAVFGRNWRTITLYPFILHSISMSLFASVIGPFGGFFASGFKRAFKIKDFGDTIPGHGGFMDRFDCQLLMATFVHVYHSSFIRAVSPQKLVQQVLVLRPEEQVQVFEMLRDSLIKRGLLSLH